MLSLILAIIVSAGIQGSTAGLETTSLEFQRDLQNNDYISPSYTAQTLNYGNYPKQPFIVNNFGNREIAQIPFGVPRFRRTGYQIQGNPQVVAIQNLPYPGEVFYKTYRQITGTVHPQDSLKQYYLRPFYEVIEYYKAFNHLKEDGKELKPEIRLENNQTVEGVVIDNKESTQPPKEDESLKTDQKLQMTYIGYAPQSSFKDGLHSSILKSSSSMDEDNLGIPFYAVDIEKDQKSSKSILPPLLLSPYRLNSDFLTQRLINRPNYQQNNYGYSRPMIVSPYPSGRPGFPPQGNQYSASKSYLPPYRSNPSTSSPKQEDSLLSSSDSQQNLKDSSSSHDGYYLIDVQPVESGHDLSGYRAINEPFGQRPLRPIAPIFHGSDRPIIMNTNAYSNSGSVGGQQSLHKVEQQEYDSGYESHTPTGNSYSKLHTNKEIRVEQNDNKEGYTFNRGTGVEHNFASPEMGLLVRRLLMVRNSNGLQGVAWRMT